MRILSTHTVIVNQENSRVNLQFIYTHPFNQGCLERFVCFSYSFNLDKEML